MTASNTLKITRQLSSTDPDEKGERESNHISTLCVLCTCTWPQRLIIGCRYRQLNNVVTQKPGFEIIFQNILMQPRESNSTERESGPCENIIR